MKEQNQNYHHKSGVLKALGHPVRLKIVHWLISCNECNVNKMVTQLGLPQSTVSQHLGILKSKGIIAPRKEGVVTCYSIADESIKKIVELLDL